MSQRSIHPYAPYVPAGAKTLIIGTIPPYRFCGGGERQLCAGDVDFYYGSRSNRFWQLVSAAAGVQLQYADTPAAVEQRKNLLSALDMGITDMVDSCVHREGRSDDGALQEIKLWDLPGLLRAHPEIHTLLYTSRFVAKLVNRFADKGRHEGWDKGRLNGTVVIGGRPYAVRILYSPSPNALRGVDRQVRQAQYAQVFRMKKP